jgi:tetratricopeptide (TPR) repeat protein
MWQKRFKYVVSCMLVVLPAAAQTFELNQGASQASSAPSGGKKRGKPQTSSRSAETGIGWGSGIEVARAARAVQEALKRNDYSAAVESATRAANSAPQDAALWFLLGYSARLAGRYQTSIDAYQKGLQRQPSSIQGLSGLAQTYAKAGMQSEAQDVLKKVLAANPKSVNDLLLAGELALNSDPGSALPLLKRADSLQPGARSQLLIARAYARTNQPQQAKEYLDRAQASAPRDPDVLRSVASFYRDDRNYDLAIATLQKAAALPKNRGVLAELAYTYQLAGKKKEAADTYERAANTAAADTSLQLSAAQALANVREYSRSEKFLKRAEEREPQSYRLHAIRAQIAGAHDRPEEAIKEYQAALSHLPAQGVPEGPLYAISLHLSLYQLYSTQQDPAAEAELKAAQAAISQISGVDAGNQPEFLRLRALIEMAANQPEVAERDFKQALSLDPGNVNITLNYANLLWRIDRKQEAFKLYQSTLRAEPKNQAALTAMGYLSRETDPAASEKYFLQVADLYPTDYVPHLALGDLYTSQKEFDKAQQHYEKAHELSPGNPLVVAGGINAGLEGHQLPIAKNWVDRAESNPKINNFPQVMRERERYLTWTGKYEESAALGYKVLEKLPRDPEAPVYLAYDLLFLNRYEESEQIARKYQPLLQKDKDLWLIQGYINTHFGRLEEALNDFNKALELNPSVATAYMNRGFVLNDLRQPTRAARDFEAALKLRPNYGEAHLGLAFANLQLRRARPALREVNAAAQILGESHATHLARAESYRQQIQLRRAETEYRAALSLAPNDMPTRLALADALYRLHRYEESISVLKSGLGGDSDAVIYAQMGRADAQLNRLAQAVQDISAAEQRDGKSTRVLMATGEALLIMGQHQAAMDRYARALDATDSDHVATRLALARLFAQQGRPEDAQQQISLGFAEARIEATAPIAPDDFLQAGQVLTSIKEFELAEKYLQRAREEGADEGAVAIALANTYLALGETDRANHSLSVLSSNPESYENYEYLIAMGNVYRQQQDTVQALAAFAKANRMVEGNEWAERTEEHLAGQEGRQVNQIVSVGPEFSLQPIFEDINIYTTDAKIKGIRNPALLPPPRSSFETRADARYRVHLHGWPTITGLVGERNARGEFSFPSELLIQNRNTYDTIFNGGINPVLHLGQNAISFNPGLQFTIRRDTESPVDLNQNLFRQFLYVSTSSFFNWVSFSGSAMREAGPFTERNLHSRDAAAKVEFTVGRPWGKTALITGYEVRDVLFRPLVREYYTTSTYVGLQRKFGESLRAAVFGEYIRAWRVQDSDFATAQAMRPAFRLDYTRGRHWSFQASGAWSRGEGFHAYDNIQNQILISYLRSVQQPIHDGLENVPVSYPIRFSVGLQQQTFYNFGGSNRTTVRPVFQLNLF